MSEAATPRDAEDLDMEEPEVAPFLDVSSRPVLAVEHPCVIMNLDNGLKTFGPDPNLHKLLESGPESQTLPMWFRYDNPTARPILSQAASSNNILLKITVPKRTGRKRKRGSKEPFSEAMDDAGSAADEHLRSFARNDKPKTILRKMRDNADNYQMEAVGMIKRTHRYRGLADFQFASDNSPFLKNVAEHLLPLEVSKFREFKFNPGISTGPNQEIIPPPQFTDKVAGFHYDYEQNPFIRSDGVDEKGQPVVVNITGRPRTSYGYFINHEDPMPTKPMRWPERMSPSLKRLLSKIQEAMEERPVWTRRSLINFIGSDHSDQNMNLAIQLAGYQFKGGPWRAAVVKYGADPRTNPQYRVYQTVAFKLTQKTKLGSMKVAWETIRAGQVAKFSPSQQRDSHLWDGQSYSDDGKFWQLCDVTDPVLRAMIQEAPVQSKCDTKETGWYYSGTWAKIKAFMKTKMLAIKHGRLGMDTDEPRKSNCIYNDELLTILSRTPDVPAPGQRATVYMPTVLAKLEDIKEFEGIRFKRTKLDLSTGKTPTPRKSISRARRSKAGRDDISLIDGASDAPDATGSPLGDASWKQILGSDASGESDLEGEDLGDINDNDGGDAGSQGDAQEEDEEDVEEDTAENAAGDQEDAMHEDETAAKDEDD